MCRWFDLPREEMPGKFSTTNCKYYNFRIAHFVEVAISFSFAGCHFFNSAVIPARIVLQMHGVVMRWVCLVLCRAMRYRCSFWRCFRYKLTARVFVRDSSPGRFRCCFIAGGASPRWHSMLAWMVFAWAFLCSMLG